MRRWNRRRWRPANWWRSRRRGLPAEVRPPESKSRRRRSPKVQRFLRWRDRTCRLHGAWLWAAVPTAASGIQAMTPPGPTTMTPSGPPPSPPGAVIDKAADAREKVTKLLAMVGEENEHGRKADAHRLLSTLYGKPEVPSDMMRDIIGWLDQMAGTVIYSRQHLLERPYVVRPGDTLDRIAEGYNVPATLLARINGIRDPQSLNRAAS